MTYKSSDDLQPEWKERILTAYMLAGGTLLRQRAWSILRERRRRYRRIDVHSDGILHAKLTYSELAPVFLITNNNVKRHFDGDFQSCWHTLFLACQMFEMEPQDLEWPTVREMHRAGHIAALELTRNELVRKTPSVNLVESEYEILTGLFERLAVDWQPAIAANNHTKIDRIVADLVSRARQNGAEPASNIDTPYVCNLLDVWGDIFFLCDSALSELGPYHDPLVERKDTRHVSRMA